MTIAAISVIVGVALLLLLKLFFKEEGNAEESGDLHGIDHDELFKEDLDFDPSWAILSSNTHHSEDD